MIGSASPVSFHDLRGVQGDTDRFVHGDAGFKPANQGSLLGRVMSWLNETFRPGHVRQENSAAYDAAKKAFIAEGGNTAAADRIFNAGIASGQAFTPAAIRPAHQLLFSSAERQHFFDRIKDDIDTRRANAAGGLMITAAGTNGQVICEQFNKDVHRQTNAFAGQVIPQSSSATAAAEWCDALAAQGLDAEQITGLSSVTHQMTVRCVMDHLVSPDGHGLKVPNGKTIVPFLNLSQSYDITPNGDGSFKVALQGGSAIRQVFTVDAETTSSPIDVDPGSRIAVDLSMTVGPGPNGTMTLLSVDRVRFDLDVFHNNARLI